MKFSIFNFQFSIKSGFTLIEFLIVISLIGVIVFFSWQGLANLGSKQELDNTVLSVTSLLRDAQQRSITQENGQSWGVRFKEDRYLLFSTSQSLNGTITNWATSTSVILKPILRFNLSTESLMVAFWQINGELALAGCPSAPAKEVNLELVNGTESAIIKVFCNGKIQY